MRKKTLSKSKTGIRKNPVKSPDQIRYKIRILLRKLLLYFVLTVSFIITLFKNIDIYNDNYKERLKPQIRRAVIQVARIIPQLEDSELALRTVCDQMENSWVRISSDGILDASDYDIPDTDAKLEMFISETLSWMDRVTKLKVGRDGAVVVLDKNTRTVIAHPDESLIGIQLDPDPDIDMNRILDIKSVTSKIRAEDLDVQIGIFEYRFPEGQDVESILSLDEYMRKSMYGCMMEYEDYYIICGISAYERAGYLVNAFIVTLILFILIWLIIRWISLVINRRCETARSLRIKLISYSLIVCIISFAISIYFQVLTNVADELKTMTHHAEVAVETLDTYQKQSDKLSKWIDSFYEIQCRLAAKIVKGRIKGTITREDMQRYANYLCVKYVFVFDEDGNVLVTNSNYDHLKVGTKPGDTLYEFRVLLEGADFVSLPPVKDERYNEYLQYMGVSIRDDKDLCDGFVLIAVDPSLRDELLGALTIDNVLKNLVIGLPDYAVAIDKNTLNISATTGLGFVGESVESLGISKNNLEQNFSGFIQINDVEYYAGVSASADYYLVPIMRRSNNTDALSSSFKLVLMAACVLFVIIIITLLGYQKSVLDAAPEEEKKPDAPEIEIIKEEEENPGSRGLFSGITDLLRAQNKTGFEDRWHVNAVLEHDQTPEMRIMRIIYRLLLIFCLFILLPTLYVSLNSDTRIGNLSNLTYVISGKWEKGVNIFAFTACIFLLCAMYVVAVLLDLVLYQIAKASDMRVETVCLLIKNAIKYICVIIFVYYGLAQFGVDTQTLLASAGILSLMISLGAKDMVSDILAGFFIIFESTYKVGDFIRVGSWSGIVTEIGLRTTKVKMGTDIKIFNNSSMRDIINCEDVIRIPLQMPISYDADIPEIEAILNRELPLISSEQIPGLVKPPIYEGVSSFEDSSVMIQISMYVDRSARMPATRALNREIKLIFDREGIEIPFNQLVIHEADNN
jgi:small conductance mechanosensitive channel